MKSLKSNKKLISCLFAGVISIMIAVALNMSFSYAAQNSDNQKLDKSKSTINQPEIKTLAPNGDKFLPIFNGDNGIPGVKFYDKYKQELPITDMESVKNLGAEYYSAEDGVSFTAIRWVDGQKYDDVYSCDRALGPHEVDKVWALTNLKPGEKVERFADVDYSKENIDVIISSVDYKDIAKAFKFGTKEIASCIATYDGSDPGCMVFWLDTNFRQIDCCAYPRSLYLLSIIISRTFDGSPTTGHNITVQNVGDGVAVANFAKAEKDTKVSLLEEPNAGCHFDGWEVNPAIQIAEDNTFIMPDQDVTIKAKFVCADVNAKVDIEDHGTIEGSHIGLTEKDTSYKIDNVNQKIILKSGNNTYEIIYRDNDLWTFSKWMIGDSEAPESGVIKGDTTFTAKTKLKKSIKPLTIEGCKYLPVFNGNNGIKGVKFLDKDFKEIQITNMASVKMAEYYKSDEGVSFKAVRSVNGVKFNEVYGADTTSGIKKLDATWKENNLKADEKVETLSNGNEPCALPQIDGVYLEDIYKSYNSEQDLNGFGSMYGDFWSNISIKADIAWGWRSATSHWYEYLRDNKSVVCVCVSRTLD